MGTIHNSSTRSLLALSVVGLLGSFVGPTAPLRAQSDTAQASATLFRNVKVFDGRAGRLGPGTSVLVVGNRIAKIGPAIAAPEHATVIDGGGRTLMPGLIDAHWHAMLVRPTPAEALCLGCRLRQSRGRRGGDGDAAARVHHGARRGWPGVRAEARHRRRGRRRPADLSVRRDDHHHERSRRFPSARSSCRARWRSAQTRMEQLGGSVLADSPDEVRLRTREQLMLGATQIKLTAGGGVASPHSPLDVTHLHRAGAARRGRSRRELGHLRHRARLHAGVDPARDPRRRAMHRARSPDGRGDARS